MEATKDNIELKHNWGRLSFLTSSLIWAKYGYWAKGCAPPEWYDNELKLAEQLMDIIQPPDTQYSITFDEPEIPGKITGHFKVWDINNPWVEPWEVGFQYTSKEHALRAYQADYHNHKHLHDGVINALIHYKETGEPIEPEWLPKTNSTEFHWLKKDYNPKDYTGFRKLKRANC